jgi:hypothetical protein
MRVKNRRSQNDGRMKRPGGEVKVKQEEGKERRGREGGRTG